MLALSNFIQFGQRSALVVGIEMQVNGLALTAVDARSERSNIKVMEYQFADGEVPLDALLGQWVAKYKLEKAHCHFVLSREAYQLLLVEPPDVAEEEIRSAIRWRLKDLISIPADQAAIDVFPLPKDGTKAKKKMVYVVAAEVAKIKSIIQAIRQSGLALKTIDIGELAIRNLAGKVISNEQSDRGVAVARLTRGSGSVYIYRQHNMYLARSFNLDYNAGLMDELPQEALALELQRSVDYYERQMGQAPPASILLCGDHISEDKIGPTLKASLAIPIEILNPLSILEADPSCVVENIQFCIASLGAALRSAESY